MAMFAAGEELGSGKSGGQRASEGVRGFLRGLLAPIELLYNSPYKALWIGILVLGLEFSVMRQFWFGHSGSSTGFAMVTRSLLVAIPYGMYLVFIRMWNTTRGRQEISFETHSQVRAVIETSLVLGYIFVPFY